VAECLGRSLDSVKMKARKLQLRKSENWGAAEDRLLCGSYPDQECERIAARLGRTVAAVRARVITLGLETKVRNWTAAEVRFLRDSYRKLEVDRIAGELGRTRAATVRKARALGLVQFRHWSREDAGTLRELYSRCPARELARRLGRPYQSVRDKARRLGLRKRSPPAESGRISPGTSEGNGTDGRGETPGWGRVTRE